MHHCIQVVSTDRVEEAKKEEIEVEIEEAATTAYMRKPDQKVTDGKHQYFDISMRINIIM